MKSVLIFGVLSNEDLKDDNGTYAGGKSIKGPANLALIEIKEKIPELYLIVDVCLCAFTNHGHCCILNEDGSLNNELSVKRF